jgi:hypothetical protein
MAAVESSKLRSCDDINSRRCELWTLLCQIGETVHTNSHLHKTLKILTLLARCDPDFILPQ